MCLGDSPRWCGESFLREESHSGMKEFRSTAIHIYIYIYRERERERALNMTPTHKLVRGGGSTLLQGPDCPEASSVIVLGGRRSCYGGYFPKS